MSPLEPSIYTSVMPLLSALVGGIIAIVAALLAASKSHANTVQRDFFSTQLQKTEELYDLLLRAEHEATQWNNAFNDKDPSQIVNSLGLQEYERNRINLLCDLYHPNRSGQASEVMEAHSNFGCAVLEWLMSDKDKEMTLDVDEAFEIFRKKTKFLRGSIVMDVNKSYLVQRR